MIGLKLAIKNIKIRIKFCKRSVSGFSSFHDANSLYDQEVAYYILHYSIIKVRYDIAISL